MTRYSVKRATVGALLLLSLTHCRPADDNNGSGTGAFPRAQTLFVGGRQWGEPSSFNPLLGSPDWPVAPGINLLYETLFTYNPLSGSMEPALGDALIVRDNEIEVTLNPAARWNDGRPVTLDDVKYTFELGKKYKSVPVAPVWNYLSEIRVAKAAAAQEPAAEDVPVVGATPEGAVVGGGGAAGSGAAAGGASGATTGGAAGQGATPDAAAASGGGGGPANTAAGERLIFVLNPKSKNPLVVLDSLQETRILPRHVLAPLFDKGRGDINEFTKLKFDKDPVVSGPYRLHSYSSEKIAVVRNDAYWGNAVRHGGKLPAPKYIVHPIYKSNDHFSVALQQGRLDASSTFVPRIWLKQRKGVRSWFQQEPFFIAAAMPMLFVNVLHPPLNDVHMRRAMAFAINYRDIRELAVSGYSEPLKPGLILPFGLESKYYSAEDAKQYGTEYDPERARATLGEGGYKPVFGPNGELIQTLDAQGRRVPTVYIKSPTGWSDWESIVRIAVRSMREVGIDARERFVDASLFWQGLFAGDFDLIMNTPASPPSPSKPWSRFEAVMTSQDWVPEGDKMYKNMGRFNNPKAANYVARVDELLNLIPTLKDEAALVSAYRELNRLFMQYQPTLPLVYRPDQFYEFSVRHWENFPTAESPFLPPQLPGDRMGTSILWHLKPANSN